MKKLFFCVLLLVNANVGASENAFTSSDYRIPVPVTVKERNQILYEMRDFLHGWHNIHLALGRNDMKSLVVEIQPMAMTLERLPVSVQERLPEGFMQMWLAMNEAFKQLAKIGEANGEVARANEQIAEITTYCSGCHDTYRLEITRPKATKH